MAMNPQLMFRGTLSTTETTLFTVPAAQTAVVTELVLTNGTASARVVNVKLNNVLVAGNLTVPANTVQIITLHQVLPTGQTIRASASVADVTCHISGVTYS